STEVATEKHGSHIAAEPTGGSRRVRQRCSQLDFVDPRAIDGTRYRQETNSPRPAMAEALVPGVATACDERGQRQAFDVLNQRRAASDTAFEGARRGRRRTSIAGVDIVHRRRFLARDVAGRRRDDAGPPAYIARSLSQRLLERRHRRSV